MSRLAPALYSFILREPWSGTLIYPHTNACKQGQEDYNLSASNDYKPHLSEIPKQNKQPQPGKKFVSAWTVRVYFSGHQDTLFLCLQKYIISFQGTSNTALRNFAPGWEPPQLSHSSALPPSALLPPIVSSILERVFSHFLSWNISSPHQRRGLPCSSLQAHPSGANAKGGEHFVFWDRIKDSGMKTK